MTPVALSVLSTLQSLSLPSIFSHALAYGLGALSVFAYKLLPGLVKDWRGEWQSDRKEAIRWYERVANNAHEVDQAVHQSPEDADEQIEAAIGELEDCLGEQPMMVDEEVVETARRVVAVQEDRVPDGSIQFASGEQDKQLREDAAELRRLAQDEAGAKREQATRGRRLLDRLLP